MATSPSDLRKAALQEVRGTDRFTGTLTFVAGSR